MAQGENFPIDQSTETSKGQSELARENASFAKEIYLRLAHESRAIASLIAEYLKHKIDGADFAQKFAQHSATIQDSSENLLEIFSSIPNVLVDPKPDAAGKMSRLSITARERDDLIRLIDTGFGKRARSATNRDLPPMDAAVTLVRTWLTTSGHTPRR